MPAISLSEGGMRMSGPSDPIGNGRARLQNVRSARASTLRRHSVTEDDRSP
jgi:hypothetical protein